MRTKHHVETMDPNLPTRDVYLNNPVCDRVNKDLKKLGITSTEEKLVEEERDGS